MDILYFSTDIVFDKKVPGLHKRQKSKTQISKYQNSKSIKYTTKEDKQIPKRKCISRKLPMKTILQSKEEEFAKNYQCGDFARNDSYLQNLNITQSEYNFPLKISKSLPKHTLDQFHQSPIFLPELSKNNLSTISNIPKGCNCQLKWSEHEEFQRDIKENLARLKGELNDFRSDCWSKIEPTVDKMKFVEVTEGLRAKLGEIEWKMKVESDTLKADISACSAGILELLERRVLRLGKFSVWSLLVAVCVNSIICFWIKT